MGSNENTQLIELEGIVVEALPNALFHVKFSGGQGILAHLAGKMRLNKIKVLLGDKVLVEMSPYDLQKGRIIRRLK